MDDNQGSKGGWLGFEHEDWVISTRGEHHICHDIHMLMNVRSIGGVTVTLPNGDTLTASVMGEVDLHGFLLLKNVLYIPEYRVNVVSVDALQHSGNFTVQFQSGEAFIKENETNETICIGKVVNGLYVIRK